MRVVFAIGLLFLTLASCSKKEVPPPPVTDTAYFDAKIDSLASELINNASKKISKAAVLDFKNPDGRTSQLGRYLSTKFITISAKKKLFLVPSQGQVDEVLKKQGITFKGSLKKEDSAKLGKALGVDGLIVGVMSDLQKGSDIDLMVKIIEARSGNVISAANTNLYRSKSISSLIQSY